MEPSKHEHIPFRNKPLRDSLQKAAPAVVYRQSTHPLPYFAHQPLDPNYFPANVAQPIGGPRGEGDGEAWDDDDSDAAADLESEAEDDMENSAGSKPKTRRKSKGRKSMGTGDVKKMKIVGGRPAVAKKVTADLDSDDELIVRMKEARFLEKDIAQALIDQGRTAYNPKTIGTRWRRLKAALQKRQDDLLDADLTDWHEGDDDSLLQAVVKADKEVERLIAEIKSRKWRMVADNLKTLKPVVNFSQNACRDRYESLMNGTAKPTPESIPNPTPEILERIQSRKDKIARIREGQQIAEKEKANMEANGWTSRMRTYF